MMVCVTRVYLLVLLCFCCASLHAAPGGKTNGQPVFKDTAYMQRYSIKYGISHVKNPNNITLQKVYSDRNGVVQVYSSEGLLATFGGQFLFPGDLRQDASYPAMLNKKIKNIGVYQNQFVYVDDKAVLSNAWAGKLYSRHTMPDVTLFSGGNDFSFLLSNGTSLQLINDSKVLWQGQSDDKLLDIIFDKTRNAFWLLGQNSVAIFSVADKSLQTKYNGTGLTSFALANNNGYVVVGTHNGYVTLNASTGAQEGSIQQKLPCPDVTVVKELGNKLWFGSTDGAYMLLDNGKYKYYASKRWLPSNTVTDIAAGSDGTILILTDKGLAEVHEAPMTLYDKAMYYEKQVRTRHIRLGFNATLSRMTDGDVTTGSLEDSDNDGLWTAMYLGGEVFRYAATKSPEALENCRESLDAMERLYTVPNLKGFPARSFERHGYAESDNPRRKKTTPVDPKNVGNAGVEQPFSVWRQASDSEWDWKSTTSSDEAIGHMFVFGAIAELIDVPDIKNKAIKLMDALMQHIVDHGMYMIDWNGKPTTWGRWNPEYVNARPVMVGDRKITSSNIVSMLQTAYHFTGKSIYKEKALELMNKYGFLENLMRPFKDINRAPDTADALSKELSDGWNHSDDEMYFVGYWGLYRYALNDTLKEKFKAAILDHWQIERPEKEGAWDIFTAITGVKDFDLDEAAGYLQKYPLDMVEWKVKNSTRKDINFMPSNFRKQFIEEVLPPDESPISRHNSNFFDLDGGNEKGSSEYSAGDIWLLPYWMGRYLQVISAPAENKLTNASTNAIVQQASTAKQTAYEDVPFAQRYSIKYYTPDSTKPTKVAEDHNGNIKVVSAQGLLMPKAGALLNPGTLVKDITYLPILEKNITGITLYKNEFVYAGDKAVFSNAWAGTINDYHQMPGATVLAGGNDFSFLVSDGNQIKLTQQSQILWSGQVQSPILDIQFLPSENQFWVLCANGVYYFSPVQKKLVEAYKSDGFTCFKVLPTKILVGTHNGYFQLGKPSLKMEGAIHRELPGTDLTVIQELDGSTWFGSTTGAFMLRKDGKFDYYASERWLPSDAVVDIAKGSNNSTLILTNKGLAKICVGDITLAQKAEYYEDIVRKRHIRYGFYSDYTNVKKGDTAIVNMGPHDSDNLWTSMYFAGEVFRYLVTHEPEAKQNCRESLDAMERLFSLSGITGLFGRCIERTGVVTPRAEIRPEEKFYWYPGYDSVPSSWKHTPGGEWDWRGSASSDQAVGQYYALTTAAQYMDDSAMKAEAIDLIDKLTGYILDNDLKLIDVDGRPTLWGIWNPSYVNRFPNMVGDKKLYSSNIISFLQTAWHFTGKEKYKAKAEELLYKEHYLENLARPISEIGPAPATADKWSQILSGGWNASDDEMYFLAYWGLYQYAINDSVKSSYKEAIRDHWDFIRPEKEGLWNMSYGAITGAKDFDLNETIWELQKMPLDLANWKIHNSNRKDIVYVKETSLQRPTKEVLPPDERPENKHNRNLFKLDDNGGGQAELGGGDVYLLPYWMGRYFGKISAPTKSNDDLGIGSKDAYN